jgi:hypothetical protein
MTFWNSKGGFAIRSISFGIWMLLTTGVPGQLLAQQRPAPASTVEITDGPIPGHAVDGIKLMDAPCSFGAHYHYELTSEGELRVKGPIVCGKFNGVGGGEQVCYLDPQLACQARRAFSPSPGTRYAVNSNGVIVGTRFYPWATPKQAVPLFALVRERAKSKCDEVLFRQAERVKHKKPIVSSDDEIQAQEGCKPILEEICKSARGGLARLRNGKDISVLCLRQP